MGFDELLRHAEKALIDLDAEALVAAYAPEFLLEDTCSGRKRISVLENVLGYTMSATITVLNSYSMKADCDFVDSTTKSNTEECR